MKILHVIHSANPAGGGPIEAVKQLAAGLELFAPGQHSLEVATLDAPGAPWLADFPPTLRLHALGGCLGTFGYTPNLIPWLKKNHRSYGMLVADGLWQFNSIALWRATRQTKAPYAVFSHGMLDPWFKERYPLKHFKKQAFWLAGQYWALKAAGAVLFTTEEERLRAQNAFFPYHLNQAVVNYGTSKPPGDGERQKALFLERFPELSGTRILLFLGRLHPKKGCDLLVQAFHELLSSMPETTAGLRLVFAGPDSVGLSQSLYDAAAKYGLANRITFTGLLLDDMKWGAFRAAEAFVLPSHQENFGFAVVEALACGVPVLISNKVAIWREIEEDHAGLVESDDLTGTVALLKRWSAMCSPEREAVARDAQRCYQTRFELAKAAESYLEALEAIRQGKLPSANHASQRPSGDAYNAALPY